VNRNKSESTLDGQRQIGISSCYIGAYLTRNVDRTWDTRTTTAAVDFTTRLALAVRFELRQSGPATCYSPVMGWHDLFQEHSQSTSPVSTPDTAALPPLCVLGRLPIKDDITSCRNDQSCSLKTSRGARGGRSVCRTDPARQRSTETRNDKPTSGGSTARLKQTAAFASVDFDLIRRCHAHGRTRTSGTSTGSARSTATAGVRKQTERRVYRDAVISDHHSTYTGFKSAKTSLAHHAGCNV